MGYFSCFSATLLNNVLVSVNKPSELVTLNLTENYLVYSYSFLVSDFYFIVQCHLNLSMNFGFVQCVDRKHVAI